MFVPDLLFGSHVIEALRAGGYEPVLVSNLDALQAELAQAEAVIVDLTVDAASRIGHIRQALATGVRTLAFYSHVEHDVRKLAEQAGFDLVVPRSRMAREGASLVRGLLTHD